MLGFYRQTLDDDDGEIYDSRELEEYEKAIKEQEEKMNAHKVSVIT